MKHFNTFRQLENNGVIKMKSKRIAGYVRVSTDEQKKFGYSIQAIGQTISALKRIEVNKDKLLYKICL